MLGKAKGVRTGPGAAGTLAAWVVGLSAAAAVAQEVPGWKATPGYARYEAMNRQTPGALRRGALAVTWVDGGKALEYRKDGKAYRYDLAAKATKEVDAASSKAPEAGAGRRGRGRAGGPERGRQAASAPSPDGTLRAFSRDRNLWLGDPNGLIDVAVTTDGSAGSRVKYGTASWVYGEELDQDSAIWWAPDGKKVAYYRFDESGVTDYVLGLDQTKLQSKVDAEPYPKAGTPDPVADLFVYDLKAKKSVKLDVRSGEPFSDGVVGHYVYHVAWSPDGKALLFHRTNRRQNVLELAAADPETGNCRTVVREEWPASWVENNPETRFLKDGQRFLWATQKNGYKNYDLYDLSGKLLNAVTANAFEAGGLARVDEEKGLVDYLAHDGDNPLKVQLHRVGLDGKGDRRLTDPSLHHSVDVAPDGAHVIDVAESHDTPPATRLLDDSGRVVDTLAEADPSEVEGLGLKKVEGFTFKAADGETDLYGLLYRPSNFDPDRKYPLLVSVYAGPETNGARETFAHVERRGPRESIASATVIAELGFLVASVDARSAGHRGKTFLDAIYLKFGRTEIDDLAAGVKALRERSYVDGGRVGIFGTSYGGYATILAMLRHPDVFQAGCASSPVTDFRNYDTIYTERYMRTPADNAEGYDAGSAVKLADRLKGRLMLFYGTADNNVHPSNTMQLVQALNAAGKSYEVQVGPDKEHSSIPRDRMMEFFVGALKPDGR